MDKKEEFNRQQVIDLKLKRAELQEEIKELEDTISRRDAYIRKQNYKMNKLKKQILDLFED
tara:strand:- start:1159 stop:1341 length:183 start_codon:yes stop_codon:yes gene_type:complete